jgi:hypothetical protein
MQIWPFKSSGGERIAELLHEERELGSKCRTMMVGLTVLFSPLGRVITQCGYTNHYLISRGSARDSNSGWPPFTVSLWRTSPTRRSPLVTSTPSFMVAAWPESYNIP